MNSIWNIVEPYILTLIGALGGGSIVGVIAYIICKRIIAKAIEAYNIEVFAAKVAEKLYGKTLNVDLTAIAEDRLKEICTTLYSEVKTIATEVNSFKHLLALMGKALTHLKMLTDEERAELIAAVKELDADYKPPEKEVIATVRLEPITATKPHDDAPQDALNFG